MVSHPETGSDSPIGSDRESGRDSDFGYYVVNNIKCHFWLNAYFVKELH